MASKEYVLRALSDSHLRAIGKVAAQWSSLETTMLRAIADVASIEFETLLLFVGSSGTKTWTELLIALSGEGKKSLLSTLCHEINELYAMRNQIVHCDWKPPIKLTPGMGLLGATFTDPPKATERATGTGIKKRSAQPLVPIAFTAREMLAVAKQIAAAERDLLGWKRLWTSERLKEHVRGLSLGLLAGPIPNH